MCVLLSQISPHGPVDLIIHLKRRSFHAHSVLGTYNCVLTKELSFLASNSLFKTVYRILLSQVLDEVFHFLDKELLLRAVVFCSQQ